MGTHCISTKGNDMSGFFCYRYDATLDPSSLDAPWSLLFTPLVSLVALVILHVTYIISLGFQSIYSGVLSAN